MTYSQKCRHATSKEQLQEIIRDLKKQFNSEEMKNFSIANED